VECEVERQGLPDRVVGVLTEATQGGAGWLSDRAESSVAEVAVVRKGGRHVRPPHHLEAGAVDQVEVSTKVVIGVRRPRQKSGRRGGSTGRASPM
jgi:hypothetical protein